MHAEAIRRMQQRQYNAAPCCTNTRPNVPAIRRRSQTTGTAAAMAARPSPAAPLMPEIHWLHYAENLVAP
jgi:hypothetical protein